MKKTRIKIPRGGLPPHRPAPDPDTPFHARLRVIVGISAALLYVGLIIGSLMGRVDLPWAIGVVVGCFGVILIPAVHYGIRPGTGKSWLITIAVVPLIVLFPYIMIPVALIALFVQGIRTMREPKRREAH